MIFGTMVDKCMVTAPHLLVDQSDNVLPIQYSLVFPLCMQGVPVLRDPALQQTPPPAQVS